MVLIDDDHEDFDDFMSRVTDVEKTIKGLIDGKIKPEEVDRKDEDILRKQRLAEEKKLAKKREEERRLKKLREAQERKKWGFVGRFCPRCRRDELQIMESAYGSNDRNWPSEGLERAVCISQDCKDIDGGIGLLSNEERRAQLQAKVQTLSRSARSFP